MGMRLADEGNWRWGMVAGPEGALVVMVVSAAVELEKARKLFPASC